MLMLTRVDLGNTEMGINAIIQIAKSMQTNTTVMVRRYYTDCHWPCPSMASVGTIY